MDFLLWLLVVVAIFGVVLGGLTLGARRARRRGGDGSGMAPFEEIWHPAAHRASIEKQGQAGMPGAGARAR